MHEAPRATPGSRNHAGDETLSDRRRTIQRAVSLEGIGLHLGVSSKLTFRPAEDKIGIVFRRVDLPGQPTIPARIEHAELTERRTQLGKNGVELHTVEHVLAAVAAAEIDDLWIDVDSAEPPVMDGSAAPFFDALREAGVAAKSTAADYLRLTEPVRVIDGESVYEAHPSPDLRLEVTIDFPHPVIGRQSGAYAITPEAFGRELAAARTFGFVHEVEALRAKGLIKGASVANAVVLDATSVVSEGLRWPDEFVRHKAMDCVGDLALAGRRVRARVIATKPSHRGTVTLVRELVRVAQVEKKQTIPIEEIMKVLAHRYPFLLVDRILEIEDGKRVVGIKNVTINEPFFQGHFPGHPIMPGVLIIEAMAQTGGMLLMGMVGEPYDRKVVYFISLDNVKWRRPVKPGDQLRMELEMVQIRGPVCKMRGIARVDGDVVAEADMAAMVRDA
ncbi:MAG TPA: bifunctional UDP-3-O-[3-hydroxymyristoyl] N-acetylglucosamine deacetylase/3-hydroxyacyl-ACP dehydratase [Gemmatimonadaceae bacterium]|nr:bifunctional UDP-3-O-[3-hydroxymyristoyl] N-acetylglucosamine deacetylase/3-hydroxyacyl-ACP dehydratase [Gemmatimonadaceae bacterium]